MQPSPTSSFQPKNTKKSCNKHHPSTTTMWESFQILCKTKTGNYQDEKENAMSSLRYDDEWQVSATDAEDDSLSATDAEDDSLDEGEGIKMEGGGEPEEGDKENHYSVVEESSFDQFGLPRGIDDDISGSFAASSGTTQDDSCMSFENQIGKFGI